MKIQEKSPVFRAIFALWERQLGTRDRQPETRPLGVADRASFSRTSTRSDSASAVGAVAATTTSRSFPACPRHRFQPRCRQRAAAAWTTLATMICPSAGCAAGGHLLRTSDGQAAWKDGGPPAVIEDANF